MADELLFEEQLSEELQNAIWDVLKDDVKDTQLTLKHARNALIKIKEQVQDYKKQIDIENHRTRWSQILSQNSSYQPYTIDWSLVNQSNTITEERIGQILGDAYIITTQMLSKLGVINEVSTTITFITGENLKDLKYMRANDIQLKTQMFKLDQNNKGSIEQKRLIFNTEKINTIKEKIKKQEIQQKFQDHFTKFIQPFVNYAENTKTGWKPNRGVLGQAFERHLESKHSRNMDFKNNKSDLGSVGRRWILYLQSSGSDPYFTGPDTKYAQVKNINASIISSMSTVLETLEALIKITNEEGNLLKSKKEIKTLLKQSGIIKSINQKTLQAMYDTAEGQVEEIIEKLIANASKYGITMTFNYKDDKGKDHSQVFRSYKEISHYIKMEAKI